MGIVINHDALPIGTGVVNVNASDGIVNINVNNPCGVCDPIIQSEVVCNVSDLWNKNLCANDSCYNHPVAKGDCLSFQFQFQNTKNGRSGVSIVPNQPMPTIPFGWFHYALNPTNFTIRAQIFNACTELEFTVPTPTTHNYADDMMSGASVFLTIDREASARTLPNRAWYKYVQNINLCIPEVLPAGFPEEFYIRFQVTPNTGSAFFIYSQVYEIAKCNPTIALEGVYSYQDCFGYNYANIDKFKRDAFDVGFGEKAKFGASIIAVTTIKAPATYRNVKRFYGTAEYEDYFVEKEIPERQCFSIKTKSYPIFRTRLQRIPPYVAEIFNNNITGTSVLLTGANTHPSTLQVQPVGGASKSNDESKMWYVDMQLRGCECIDYQQC